MSKNSLALLATTLAAVLVVGALFAIAWAGGVALGRTCVSALRAEGLRSRYAEDVRRDEFVERATAQMENLAARIAASARDDGELPETLPEAPPKDPWGCAFEYARPSPERAVLRSAGPDRRFGTKDDLRREFGLR